MAFCPSSLPGRRVRRSHLRVSLKCGLYSGRSQVGPSTLRFSQARRRCQPCWVGAALWVSRPVPYDELHPGELARSQTLRGVSARHQYLQDRLRPRPEVFLHLVKAPSGGAGKQPRVEEPRRARGVSPLWPSRLASRDTRLSTWLSAPNSAKASERSGNSSS